MSNDFLLVLGVILFALGIPSLINAFSESRPPRLAIILFVIGGGLISWAAYNQPGGYTIEEMPDVFVRVFAQIVR